jgi:acyl carrier protein
MDQIPSGGPAAGGQAETGTDVALLVRTIVAERFCRPLDEINPSTRFVDLGMDSLDMIEINIALEERLHLSMPQVAAPEELNIETVQQLADLVAAQLARQGSAGRAGR